MKSKRYLKSKLKNTQKDWLYVWNNIEEFVDYDRVKKLEEKAVEHLIKTTKGQKVAYGWTAGKDSLVLQRLCELAGIQRSYMIITQLEYPHMLDFIEKHKPPQLDTMTTKHDLKWLSDPQNHGYLFPNDSKHQNGYLRMVQRKHEKRYFFENNLDQIIQGQRTKDGNYCPDFIMQNKNGFKKNVPIKDWTHEELMAYLRYNHIDLPKIYFYEQGFKQGTGAWATFKRPKGTTVDYGWNYMYRHDPRIVHEASYYLNSAKEYLVKEGLIEL